MTKTSKPEIVEKSTKSNSSVKNVVARGDDGTIQVTFTIPQKLVESTKLIVYKDLSKNIEVPGFRKGNAPIEKVKDQVSQQAVIENVLSKILPKALGEIINKEKIRLAITPKYELIKADDNSDWQVRALMCEIPDVALGEYQKALKDTTAADEIWTPDKQKKPESKLSRSQKEEKILKTLVETVKINLPKMLIEQEVNNRLAQLLSQIERLGLTLDAYLTSISKTADQIRQEYSLQAENGLKIELILNKIAQEKNIRVTDQEIEEVIKATNEQTASSKLPADNNTQKLIIKSILARRKALEELVKTYFGS